MQGYVLGWQFDTNEDTHTALPKIAVSTLTQLHTQEGTEGQCLMHDGVTHASPQLMLLCTNNVPSHFNLHNSMGAAILLKQQLQLRPNITNPASPSTASRSQSFTQLLAQLIQSRLHTTGLRNAQQQQQQQH
jgi:hypothetical protein